MTGYGQFCPVAKTSELLCERWMPLIVRELLCGSRRFSELQRGVPTISPALLSKRLRQLAAAGVIERCPARHGAEYVPTAAGWELYPIIEAMGVWGQRWARSDYSPDELDPGVLMWDMRRMLQPGGLGRARTVVVFRFSGAPPGRSMYWLVVEDSAGADARADGSAATSDAARDGIDLCLVDPGLPVDLWVRADLRSLTQVWMGDRTMQDAIGAGTIELLGQRQLVRRFPDWLGRHPVLGGVAPAAH